MAETCDILIRTCSTWRFVFDYRYEDDDGAIVTPDLGAGYKARLVVRAAKGLGDVFLALDSEAASNPILLGIGPVNRGVAQLTDEATAALEALPHLRGELKIEHPDGSVHAVCSGPVIIEEGVADA